MTRKRKYYTRKYIRKEKEVMKNRGEKKKGKRPRKPTVKWQINPALSVISLNANELNTPIRRQRLAN